MSMLINTLFGINIRTLLNQILDLYSVSSRKIHPTFSSFRHKNKLSDHFDICMQMIKYYLFMICSSIIN